MSLSLLVRSFFFAFCEQRDLIIGPNLIPKESQIILGTHRAHTYTNAHVRSEGRDSRGREKETRRAPRARIFDGSPGAEGREGEHANKLALYLKQLLGIAVTHERGSGPYCGPSETTVRAGDEERRVESGLREAAERGVVAEEEAKEAKERARSRGRK